MPKIFVFKNKIFLDDFVRLCAVGVKVKLNSGQKMKIKIGRERVEKLIKSGKRIYGVNTGFGALAQEAIGGSKIAGLQVNLIRSHACGVGEPFSSEVVRGAMLLLINSLSRGYSGVSLGTVETLVEILNRDIISVIPEKGSVGASGDLAPLAHLALTLIGEGEVYYQNKRQSAKNALLKAGLKPVKLEAKEGLALLNGTHFMTALAALNSVRAARMLAAADIASAISLEALKGTNVFLRADINRLKPHPGQLRTADNLRRLVRGSQIIVSHKDCPKIQDPYSLRCVPQVHGASRDAAFYVKKIVETEMNSVTDNPLIFGNNRIVSGGNFHGQAVALAMDFLGIALSELADISERRVEKLINHQTSGLPPFLIKESGFNSGFMVAQYTAASLVSHNKVLAHPASVDSIPTSAGQEDHVSMGSIACRKAREICDNTENVLAVEFLCAVQALDFLRPLKAGKGVEAAREVIRRYIPFIVEDAVLSPYISRISSMIRNGLIQKEVENSVGKL